MGLLDKLKNVFTGGPDHISEFEKVISQTNKEYAEKHEYFWSANLNETTLWNNEVKNWPDKKKINFAIWLIRTNHHYLAGKRSWSSADKEQQKNTIRQAYLQSIFRNKLVMDDDDVKDLLEAFTDHRSGDWASFTSWPIGLMLNQLEKQRKNAITPSLRSSLEKIRKEINAVKNYYDEKDRIKMMAKIDAMLFIPTDQASTIRPVKLLGEDALSQFVNAELENLPAEEKNHWYKLLPLAQKATGSKPSKKYLDETKNIIKELGADKFKKTLHGWLRFLVNLKENVQQHTQDYGNHTYTYTTSEYITAVNAEAMKGLIWACCHFHDATTIQTVATLAERAFKKIPGKGPTAASMGNACLYVLYKSKGLDGIGQLSRLKLRIKQGSTQALIDKYLEAAAEEQGVTVHEIEDMAVDDYGIENGSRSFAFDDYKAELVITGIGRTEQKWYKPDGSPQKSVPAIIKEKHAARLKKLNDVGKQVEQTLVAQRDRIDRMFRTNRKISWTDFEKYYLEHGLVSYIANKIIWNLHLPAKTEQAIYLNGQWVNATNELLKPVEISELSLWHPVQASVAEIKEWRQFLVFHEILQPVKQAFRELYLLTDAEVNTKSYSNRMAAHLLRQHQFNSLAKSRGWRYSLLGAFDNGIDRGIASLALPEYNLRAEYWINELLDTETNDTGIWNYVSTDQVRFINTTNDQPVDLIDVPPLVFSEVMRDTDLFVGVASVGNDPEWADHGEITGHQNYWRNYSFGDLGEIAKNRKEILADLVPRLKINPVSEIRDKFLVVKGKKRTYKIHIGSTNILMEPNDQYLCIVPDRRPKSHTENVFLPFEGDNGLSIILSKAFLLAEDDKITDPTILSQINSK